MKTKYLLWGAIIIVAGFLIYTAVNHRAATPSDRLAVSTSFYPMYFFAQQVGGDKADVTNVTPAGGEPHDYEPTAQDVARIEASRLLILNGGGLETWGDKIKQNLTSQTIVVTAGEGLTTQQVVEDGKNMVDPHVWLSPPLAKKMVDSIEVGFAQADPDNANYYLSNANQLKSQLDQLDGEYKQGLTTCKSPDIITSHAAFGYLATAYHLNQVPIAGLSPDAEPSPQQLATVANFAKQHNVKYIFFESLVSPKLSQTIADEVGAQTLVLNPIEGLTDSELLAGKNYLTVMRQNLVNLKTALGCNS